MPADDRRMEQRLDMLGAVVGAEMAPVDPDGAFMAGVRRRGRARAWGRAALGAGGVLAAATAVVMAVVMGSPSAPSPVPTPVVVQGEPGKEEGPTLGALARLARESSGVLEMPGLPMSGSGLPAEASLRRGSILSGAVTEGILRGQ